MKKKGLFILVQIASLGFLFAQTQPATQALIPVPYGDKDKMVNFAINSYNLSLQGSVDIIRVSGRGPDPGLDLVIGFTYTSAATAAELNTEGLSNGWRLKNYSINITEDPLTGAITIRWFNGMKQTFVPAAGGAYDPPPSEHGTLVKLPSGEFLYTDKFGTEYTFNDPSLGPIPFFARVIRKEDRNGNYLTLSYDANDKLLEVLEPTGRAITYHYNADGQIQTIKDPANREVQVTYDAAKNISEIKDPIGNALTFQMGHAMDLERFYNRRSSSRRFAPGGAGGSSLTPTVLFRQGPRKEVVEWYATLKTASGASTRTGTRFTCAPQNQPLTSSYTGSLTVGGAGGVQLVHPGTMVRITASRNGWEPNHWDYGNISLQGGMDVPVLVAKSGGCCDHIPFWYDDLANIVGQDENEYTYDANGNITKIKDPLGHEEHFTYGPFNQLTSHTNKRGHTITYKHDSNGNIVSINKPEGVHEAMTFDQYGNVTGITDGEGNTTQYGYDNLGNLTSIVKPLSLETAKYDVVGNLLTHTDANGNTTSFVHDDMGRVRFRTDALNNTTEFSYDEDGNIIERIDAKDIITSYTYDEWNRNIRIDQPHKVSWEFELDDRGNRIQVKNPEGKVTRYEYNSKNQLVAITNPLNKSKQFAYHNDGTLASETDFMNNTTSYTYDKLKRLKSLTNALNQTTSFDYDQQGNQIAVRDARNNATKWEYDHLNRVTTTTDALANVSTQTYNKAGYVVEQTDFNGHITQYQYDQNYRQIKVTDPMGNVSLHTYDDHGNAISYTDPEGGVWTNTFDPLNRLIARESPLGERTEYTFNEVGRLIQEKDARGNITTHQYDDLGRITQTSDLIGLINIRNYNKNSQITRIESPGNSIVTYQYDAGDRLESMINPLGKSIRYFYNDNNLVTAIFDENSKQVALTDYDPLNRVKSVEGAIGDITLYAYDQVGNLREVIDANKNRTTYQYDEVNRLTRKTFADLSFQEMTYDNNGNLIAFQKNSGEVIQSTFDKNNFLLDRIYPAGNNDHFRYDKAGRLISAYNDEATVNYAYDLDGRLIAQHLNGLQTIFTHDIPNGIQTVEYPAGKSVSYHRDLRYNIIDVSEAGQSVISYTYNYFNNITRKAFQNGVQLDVLYGNDNLVEEYRYSPNDFVFEKYDYDHTGRQLSTEKFHQPDRSQLFEYDNNYRLTAFTRGQLVSGKIPNPVNVQSFTLDDMGNRTQVAIDADVHSYQANNMNEYTAINGANLSFDDNGNLLDDQAHTFEYNDRNRLTKADNANYKYDALGRRIEKEVNGVITRYVYENNRIIEERDGSNNLVCSYVYGPYIDEVIYKEQNGQKYFYHTDILGSTVAMTDINAAIVERYEYDPFGKVTIFDSQGKAQTSSAINNAFLFTGRMLDEETGIYQYRSRYYDTDQGRFTQRDKIGYADGFNLYQYAGSDPVNHVDPMGTEYRWVKDNSQTGSSLSINISPGFLEGYDDRVTGLLKVYPVVTQKYLIPEVWSLARAKYSAIETKKPPSKSEVKKGASAGVPTSPFNPTGENLDKWFRRETDGGSFVAPWDRWILRRHEISFEAYDSYRAQVVCGPESGYPFFGEIGDPNAKGSSANSFLVPKHGMNIRPEVKDVDENTKSIRLQAHPTFQMDYSVANSVSEAISRGVGFEFEDYGIKLEADRSKSKEFSTSRSNPGGQFMELKKSLNWTYNCTCNENGWGWVPDQEKLFHNADPRPPDQRGNF